MSARLRAMVRLGVVEHAQLEVRELSIFDPHAARLRTLGYDPDEQ